MACIGECYQWAVLDGSSLAVRPKHVSGLTWSKFKEHRRLTKEECRTVLTKLRALMDRVGYPSLRDRHGTLAAGRQQLPALCATEPQWRGNFNPRTNHDQSLVPEFNNYRDFHNMMLQSFKNITIVLSIDGIIVFLSENILTHLGHRPSQIVGRSILNIIPDEEKEKVSQMIIHRLPLAHLVGNYIEFCCYVKRGNIGENGMPIYEYVKFILNLQDSYNESFVFFGNIGPNSRSIWASTTRQSWEQQYYLVGNICVSCPNTIAALSASNQSNEVVVIDSDDENALQHNGFRKRRRCSGNQSLQAKALNSKTSYSSSDVEIVAVQPPTLRLPFEMVEIRKRSFSQTSTSSVEIKIQSPVTTSAQVPEVHPYKQLEPVDLEFEVDPKFLLPECTDEETSESVTTKETWEMNAENDSEDTEDSEDYGSYSVPSHVSVTEHCVTLDDSEISDAGEDMVAPEDTVDPEYQEEGDVLPKYPRRPVQHVRAEAVLMPIVRKDITVRGTAQPPLGERFAQTYALQRRANVIELTVSRSFHRVSNSSELTEEEREQEENELPLAQHIEMFRTSANEPQTTEGYLEREWEYWRQRMEEKNQSRVDNDPETESTDYSENETSESPENEECRIQEEIVDNNSPQVYRSSESSSGDDSETPVNSTSPLSASKSSENSVQLWENATAYITEEHHHLLKEDSWLYNREDQPSGNEKPSVFNHAQERSHFMSVDQTDSVYLEGDEDYSLYV